MSGYAIWTYNRGRTRDLFLDGATAVVRGSEYLGNDFVVEGLRELGYWDLLVSGQPELGREDVAVAPEKLGAVWVFKELAGLGRVSEAETILKDGRLMAECGFNVQDIREKAFKGVPVVSRRTVYRHAERMPRRESTRLLMDTVRLARARKWLRGRVYAADCYEIPVTGEKMEGIYENTDKTGRRGYKLLTITNVTPTREQVVSAALGGICQNERVLLESALRTLQDVCEPREMIDLLILDRGFWGAQTMWHLKHRWGLDFLTMTKSDLEINAEVVRMVADLGEVQWQEVFRKSGHTGKMRRYLARGVEGVFLDHYSEDGEEAGSVNCVLAYVDQGVGEQPKQLVYVTSVPTERRERIVIYRYGERWSIENECMKWLSEHDGRKINGWTLNAVQYRAFLLLVLRNAMTLLDWKYPKDAARMRKLLAHRKRRAYLEGHGVIIYLPDDGIFGTYPSEEGVDMAEERGGRRVRKEMATEVARLKERVRQLELPGIPPRKPIVASVEKVAGNKRSPR